MTANVCCPKCGERINITTNVLVSVAPDAVDVAGRCAQTIPVSYQHKDDPYQPGCYLERGHASKFHRTGNDAHVWEEGQL